jgi:predicted O-methyltransferase YrrM
MLRNAIASVEETFSNIHLWADGVPAPDVDGVSVVHQLSPVSFTTVFNEFIRASWDDDVMFFMHSDATAKPGACGKIMDAVHEKLDSGERWGVLLTEYDALAAYNMKAVRSVGYLDPMFYQYIADDDWYHRMRMAQWEIVDTGLNTEHPCGVLHHTSAAVKNDWLFNDRTQLHNGFAYQYFDYKWKLGIPNDERHYFPFNGMHLLRLLASTPLLEALREDLRTEGNLFDAAFREKNMLEDRDTLSQLNTMYDYITQLQPRRILETGTNKGYFGYLLSLLLTDFELVTCDGDERSARAAELLGPRVRFVHGDSRLTLPQINEQFDMAWIDGGHNYEVALSDIKNAMRLDIPCIMIDDMFMPHLVKSEVRTAVEDSGLAETHHIVEPYTYAHDHRQMVVALRKGV